MEKEEKYYVVTAKAVPEVLMKVVKAKKLLETGKAETVQIAADLVGISRSSFYKYKDDIFPFYESTKGKTFTFLVQMDDSPGVLSGVLGIIATYRANILTIHQSIPVNGIATLTISVEVLEDTENTSGMINEIETMDGIYYLNILSRE